MLQIELGYNANFQAPGVSTQQDLPLALRFALNRRILLEFDGDSPYAQTIGGVRSAGFGDSQLGSQFVLQHEGRSRPGISFAYYVKLPTASAVKGLGTGRVDHNLIALVSKKFGETTVDFNAIYLIAGRTTSTGYASSAQAALAASHDIGGHLGAQGEISGYSRNDSQPGAMYVLGALTWQMNRRLVLDGGIRFGLTHDASRDGVFVGMTVGVADLYRNHHLQ